MHIDIYNGDADGLCALHQLRLAEPVDSELVTGVKRDINLLSRVTAVKGDHITVLDISLDKNRDSLLALLAAGATIQYFDHHYAGEIPEHVNLKTFIDTQPTICTSLLVNKELRGRYLAWAVTAAFGDNLYESARNAATQLQLSSDELEQLKVLGTCLNYNGYGASLEDLFYHPADLYCKIKPYQNPFDFIASDEAYQVLHDGYMDDMAKAAAIKPELAEAHVAVYFLPAEKWARRVSGVYSNDLAQVSPEKAHAVLSLVHNGIYQVSVRAPLTTKTGADTLCRQFDTGGGRKAAAGINQLPESDVGRFVRQFQQQFNP